MSRPAFALRRRIVRAFLLTVAAVCTLFGLMMFLFAYVAEDRLFANLVAEEVALQQEHWRANREFARPLRPYVSIYRDPADFPPDLRTRYDGQREFSGERGRHYHVHRFELPEGGGPAFAVAEVSLHLVVRPLRSEMLTLLAIAVAAVLLIAGFAGYVLANRAVAPLTRLADRVAGRGSGTVPDVSAADFAADEIGLLAEALEQAFGRIRALIDREVQFTRDASHELRTPLAVIRGAAELIALQPALQPAVERPLRRIEAAALDMEQAIDLLLSLARAESGPVRREAVPLLTHVEIAVLRASARFGGEGGDVTVDVPPTKTVFTDPTILTLILSNLVGNAFQHAHGAALTIRWDEADLIIVDSGPGMSTEVIGALFTPFAKGEESAGHGLGLSIVKKLCEREGIGLAVATSSAEGTRIVLSFDESAMDAERIT